MDNDLGGTRLLRLCMHEDVCLFACATVVVLVSACRSAAHVGHYADVLQPLAFTNPGL